MEDLKSIQYNIENIIIDKENGKLVICISGWFYGVDRKIEVLDINNKILKMNLEYFYREDVNQYLGISDLSNNGFIIRTIWNKEDSLVLSFFSNGQHVEYQIDGLKDKIKEYKEKYGVQKYINYRNIKKTLQYIKIFGIKKTIKVVYEKLKNKQLIKENGKIEPYKYSYEFKEEDIPSEWLKIQKTQSRFAVLINIATWEEEYKKGLDCLINQTYKNFKVFIKTSKSEQKKLNTILNDENINFIWKYVFSYADIELESIDYLIEYNLFDRMSINTLAYMVEMINDKLQPEILYGDYDFFEQEEIYHTRIRKLNIPEDKITSSVILRGLCAVKKSEDKIDSFDKYVEQRLKQIKDSGELKNKVIFTNHLLVHRNIVTGANVKPIKAIAFYLPQFHVIPENDEWWGKGFTEWTNVKRAIPMFDGHNQPRVPGELGYYDLVEGNNIQAKQANLAKEYSVYGFCYYHYWFNGKRLLEKPVEYILEHKEITQPFCICWANENWTKTWDGLHKDILIEQVHEQDSDERFIKDIINIISDERYIRIENKPLILIYKIALLQDGKKTIEKWREEVKKYGIEDLYVAIVKQPGITNAEQYGADAVVEFPPHDMNVNNITESVMGLNKDFTGGIYDYSELANRDLEVFDFPIFRTCMLQWDNTARRMERASIFHNFYEEDYKHWLLRCKEYELLFNNVEEQFVFINAWNEWAEGTYLEPDEKHGDCFLKITKEILESR